MWRRCQSVDTRRGLWLQCVTIRLFIPNRVRSHRNEQRIAAHCRRSRGSAFSCVHGCKQGAVRAAASVFDAARATPVSATGHPGRDQRACEAPSSAGFGARARSAPREVTRRACSTTVSAANGGSCATGPRARAAQGSRSAAKTASPACWALPGCPVAAPMPAKREFNVSNGPSRDSQIDAIECIYLSMAVSTRDRVNRP